MNGSKGVKHKLSPTAMWGFFVGEFGVARGRVRCVGSGCGESESGCGASESGCGASESGCGASESGCGA